LLDRRGIGETGEKAGEEMGDKTGEKMNDKKGEKKCEDRNETAIYRARSPRRTQRTA
jgi:hypothetical protein